MKFSENEFTEKEIRILRLLVGAGVLRFKEKRLFPKRFINMEDAARHFILATDVKK